jgi:hypothetical protein
MQEESGVKLSMSIIPEHSSYQRELLLDVTRVANKQL